jgi:hypothetical protein
VQERGKFSDVKGKPYNEFNKECRLLKPGIRQGIEERVSEEVIMNNIRAYSIADKVAILTGLQEILTNK